MLPVSNYADPTSAPNSNTSMYTEGMLDVNSTSPANLPMSGKKISIGTLYLRSNPASN